MKCCVNEIILRRVYWNSYCLHADQISSKLPAPRKKLSRLGLYNVLRSNVCFPSCCVYLIHAMTETSPSYGDQLGKNLYTVDRKQVQMRKVLFRQHQTVNQHPKKREIIVVKNGIAGYFFVFVHYQNLGVQHDSILVFDWLILIENKPNSWQSAIFKINSH